MRAVATGEVPSSTVGQRRLCLLAIILGSMMQVLDSSVASITLPLIQGSLSATQDQISWVMTSYLVASVIMTPLAGPLSNRLGRRRMLLIAVVGFVISAVGAGQSTTLAEIVAFRVIQGLFGAILMPVGHSTLLDVLRPEELAVGMGWRSMGIMLGMSVGPPIGGIITEHYDWRWGFYINIPVALAAFAMISAFVPESRRRHDDPVSWVGFLMLAVGLGALQLMLNRGQRLDWFESTEIVAAGVTATVGLYLFTVHSAVARRPFIDFGMFRDGNLAVGLTLVFIFVWLMFTVMVLLPAFLQDLRGYTVADAGMVMGVRAAATTIASILGGWLVARTGSRRIIVSGLLMVAWGTWQMSRFTSDVNPAMVDVAAFVFGLGSGFAFVPLNVTTFWTLAPRHRAVGTGLFALMSILGGGIGISIMVTALVRRAQTHYGDLVGHVTPFSEAVNHLGLPSAWSLDDPVGLANLAAVVNRQAFMMAYIENFRILTVLTLATVPLVYFMRKPKLVAGTMPAE